MNINDLYPGRARYYETELRVMADDSTVSERNKTDLRAFCVSLLSTGKVQQYRAGKLLSHLRVLAKGRKTDFRYLNLGELQALVVEINLFDKSSATKADYRKAIKQFYKWLENDDERLLSADLNVRESAKKIYKYVSQDMTTRFKSKRIEPSEVISDEDLILILEKGCQTEQEKAIISLLHETGMRTADLLLTKISSFAVDSRGIGTIFTGNGKTGSRQIDIIRSVPYIQEHIARHATKPDKDSYLFYFLDERSNKIKPFNHMRFYTTIKKCILRSGLKKKANPHWFRHSRASLDAMNGTMSESVRMRRMGWSEQSKMMSNYTHLGTKEIRTAWLKANGLEDDSKTKEQYFTCICRRLISSDLQYCPHCGRPASLEILNQEKLRANSLQEEINEVIPLMPEDPVKKKEYLEVIKFAMEMLNDPARLKKFEEGR